MFVNRKAQLRSFKSIDPTIPFGTNLDVNLH